jgi:hypothetical protein
MADHVTADRVTAGEIADFLRHLAELRYGTRGADRRAGRVPGREAELFTRLRGSPLDRHRTSPASPSPRWCARWLAPGRSCRWTPAPSP